MKRVAWSIIFCLAVSCSNDEEELKPVLEVDKSYRLSSPQAAMTTVYDAKKLNKEVADGQKTFDTKKNSKEPLVDADFDKLVVGQMLLRDYAGAMNNLRKAIKSDNKNDRLKILLADNAIRANKLDLAEAALNEVKKGKESSALNLRGVLAYLKNKPSDAVSFFLESKQQDGQNVSPVLNLGLLYMEHFRYDEALIEFEQVLKLDRTHFDAQLHQATILRMRKKYEAAQKILEELEETHKDSPLVFHNLAVLWFDQGEFEDALEAAETALKNAQAAKIDTRKTIALRDEIKQKIPKD